MTIGSGTAVGTTAKAVMATVIGTALEVFDFSSYSFFSVTIGKLFFPTHDPVLSLLLAALTFGVGFFVRPLGGIFSASMVIG